MIHTCVVQVRMNQCYKCRFRRCKLSLFLFDWCEEIQKRVPFKRDYSTTCSSLCINLSKNFPDVSFALVVYCLLLERSITFLMESISGVMTLIM